MRLFASSSAWLLALVALAPAVVSAGLLDHGGWGFRGTTYDYDNNNYGAPVSEVVVSGQAINVNPLTMVAMSTIPRTSQTRRP